MQQRSSSATSELVMQFTAALISSMGVVINYPTVFTKIKILRQKIKKYVLHLLPVDFYSAISCNYGQMHGSNMLRDLILNVCDLLKMEFPCIIWNNLRFA